MPKEILSIRVVIKILSHKKKKNHTASWNNGLTKIINHIGHPDLQKRCFPAQQGRRKQLLSFSYMSSLSTQSQVEKCVLCLRAPATVQAQSRTPCRHVTKGAADNNTTHTPHSHGAPSQRCQGTRCPLCPEFTIIEAVTGSNVSERWLAPRLLTQGVAVFGLDERRRGCWGWLHLHWHTLLWEERIIQELTQDVLGKLIQKFREMLQETKEEELSFS